MKKKEEIEKRLQPYSVATKRNYYIAIVSVLSFYKTKSSYNKLYNYYYEKMVDRKKEYDETRGQLSQKEKDNWITWEEVQKRKDELKAEIKEFVNKKMISDKQYQKLLQFVVLSLYTDIQPRRNKDYQLCYIIKEHTDKKEKDKNYYDMTNKEFIFNDYKTAKKHGQQKISIKDNKELVEALEMYFKHHPLVKKRMSKSAEVCLLVNRDGSKLSSVNAITRLLNKIFKKKIGSSMLRHIYLTSKYGDKLEEMKDDAEKMGHTTQEAQKTYIKKPDEVNEVLKNENINIKKKQDK